MLRGLARARPARPSVCLKSSAVRMLASLSRIRHPSRSLIRLLRRPFFALPVRRRGERPRPPTPRGSLEPQLLGSSPQYKMIRIFIAKISLVSYFSLPSLPAPAQSQPKGRVSIRGIWATHVAGFPFIFRERRRLENNLLLLRPSSLLSRSDIEMYRPYNDAADSTR